MAVIKEWRCLAHGNFESAVAVCPHGCGTVIRDFRTAPGTRSEKTKTSDRALDRLAARYQLTDMSNRNGSVASSRGVPKGMEPLWADLPKGNNYEVGKGEVARDGSAGGAEGALKATRMTGSVAAELSKKLGRELKPEPTFMELAKGLPRVRPHVVGSFGTAADLKKAIDSAP
jgi:hypothetical protein